MSFGIEVIGNDAAGSFIVTDTSKNLLGYSVIAAGAGSSVQVSGSTKQPLVFVNAKGVTAADTAGITVNWNPSNNTYYFYSPVVHNYTTSPFDADIQLTARVVNYFIVQSMDEVSPDTTQTHGVQIMASNGDIMVDSRSFPVNGTFFISKIVSAGAATAGSTITTIEDDYVEMSTFIYNDIEYSANPYGFGGGYWYRSAKFKSTHIEYYGLMGLQVTILGAAWWSEFDLDNYAPVLMGRLR